MKKRLFLGFILFIFLLTGCSHDEATTSQTELDFPAQSAETLNSSDSSTADSNASKTTDSNSSPEPTEPENIYWNEYPDGEFPHNVNSTVYSKTNTWIQENDSWYYLNQYGIKAAGRLDNHGNRYYMEPSGAMYTGWKYISGANYYFDPQDGHMVCSTSLEIENTFYSFDNLGRLLTEVWVSDEFGSYYIKSDGNRCQNGFFFIGIDTYYADEDNYIVTDTWLTIDGITYYFCADGHMAKNTIIDGKTIDAFGHLVQ